MTPEENKSPKTHGGSRKATGRKVITRSVSMRTKSWNDLDRARGALSRGKWIEKLSAQPGEGR